MLSATWNIVQSYEFNFCCFLLVVELDKPWTTFSFIHSVLLSLEIRVFSFGLLAKFLFWGELLYRDLPYVPHYFHVHNAMLIFCIFKHSGLPGPHLFISRRVYSRRVSLQSRLGRHQLRDHEDYVPRPVLGTRNLPDGKRHLHLWCQLDWARLLYWYFFLFPVKF